MRCLSVYMTAVLTLSALLVPETGSAQSSDCTKRYESTRTNLLEEVRSAWGIPAPETVRVDAIHGSAAQTSAEIQAETLRTRLAAIRLPSVSLQNAGIQQVVEELSDLCREADPDHKGINLALAGVSGNRPPVTFSGTDLSVLETLDAITQVSEMKYIIRQSVVSLMPVDYDLPQQMVSAEFDILPSAGAKIFPGKTSLPETGLVDARPFFSAVPFPSGASAQYNPELHVLLAHNTPEHIEKLRGLLARYNRKASEEHSRQIEIETKFIEVSQGTLDELGFNWTIGTTGENLTSDTITMTGGQHLFTDSLRSGQSAFAAGTDPAGRATVFNAYAGAAADPVGTGMIGPAGELLVQKVKGDLKIDLLISALERTAGSDLLCAPRIVAKSGEPACIQVGEIHWFPTAYEVEIERYAQPSLVPLDYQEERTGVMLEVTPDLNTGNGTINLKLVPEIRELAGFDEQHVGTIWPEYGDETLDLGGVVASNTTLLSFLKVREESRTIGADRLIARRPVIKTRKVSTAVTIEDGSTIAMGGLIKEQLENFKDSVPVLGKIPLIGRLFRSEGERSVKRNLLIFVTAHQVDAAGRRNSTR